MTSSAPYVPEIVRTLRHYHGKRAPRSLCERIAGGPRAWRLLNEWWNLEGARALPLPGRRGYDLGDPLVGLSMGERRMALLQIVDECGEAGCALPPRRALAEYFGVSAWTIGLDLRDMAERGEISWLVAGGRGGDGA